MLSFLGSFLFLLLVSKPYNIELGFTRRNNSLEKLPIFFKFQNCRVLSRTLILKSQPCKLFQTVHDDFIFKMNFTLSPCMSKFLTEAHYKNNAFSPRTVYMSGCV